MASVNSFTHSLDKAGCAHYLLAFSLVQSYEACFSTPTYNLGYHTCGEDLTEFTIWIKPSWMKVLTLSGTTVLCHAAVLSVPH